MKTMIITASALGVVVAGIILFFKSRTHPHERLADGMVNTANALNADAPHLERGPLAMG
jgi:hypothetical protein